MTKQYGYQYYTWFDLAIIAICILAIGVCIAAVAVQCGMVL